MVRAKSGDWLEAKPVKNVHMCEAAKALNGMLLMT
jgi:hypothetical protein